MALCCSWQLKCSRDKFYLSRIRLHTQSKLAGWCISALRRRNASKLASRSTSKLQVSGHSLRNPSEIKRTTLSRSTASPVFRLQSFASNSVFMFLPVAILLFVPALMRATQPQSTTPPSATQGPANPSRYDLNGEWERRAAPGEKLAATSKVMIQQIGDFVVATSITDDGAVHPGGLSFRGTYRSNSFAIE